jgi:hypothetical protein
MNSKNKVGSLDRGYDYCTICLCEIEFKVLSKDAICAIDMLNKNLGLENGLPPKWFPQN